MLFSFSVCNSYYSTFLCVLTVFAITNSSNAIMIMVCHDNTVCLLLLTTMVLLLVPATTVLYGMGTVCIDVPAQRLCVKNLYPHGQTEIMRRMCSQIESPVCGDTLRLPQHTFARLDF